MKSVHVVGGDSSVEEMFEDEGWLNFDVDARDAAPDLVCFTGGADVMPQLYGETNEGLSHCDPVRDLFEEAIYKKFVIGLHVPAVGICRGGQFLNVMNGGKLIQDHGLISGYKEMAGYTGDGYKTAIIGEVHVDHHQGILARDGTELAWIGWDEYPRNVSPDRGHWPVYVCFYPETKCLCFQPHPEWGHSPTKDLFFSLIQKYLNL